MRVVHLLHQVDFLERVEGGVHFGLVHHLHRELLVFVFVPHQPDVPERSLAQFLNFDVLIDNFLPLFVPSLADGVGLVDILVHKRVFYRKSRNTLLSKSLTYIHVAEGLSLVPHAYIYCRLSRPVKLVGLLVFGLGRNLRVLRRLEVIFNCELLLICLFGVAVLGDIWHGNVGYWHTGLNALALGFCLRY